LEEITAILYNTSLTDALSVIAITIASLSLINSWLSNRGNSRQIASLNRRYQDMARSQSILATANIDIINQRYADTFLKVQSSLRPILTKIENSALDCVDNIGRALDQFDSNPKEREKLRHEFLAIYCEIERHFGPVLLRSNGVYIRNQLGGLQYIFDDIRVQDNTIMPPTNFIEKIIMRFTTKKLGSQEQRASPLHRINASSRISIALSEIVRRIPDESIQGLNALVIDTNNEYLSTFNLFINELRGFKSELETLLSKTKYRSTSLNTTTLGNDIERLYHELDVITNIGNTTPVYFHNISSTQYISNLIHLSSVIYIISQRSMWGKRQ
jgi:hypothetical protein